MPSWVRIDRISWFLLEDIHRDLEFGLNQQCKLKKKMEERSGGKGEANGEEKRRGRRSGGKGEANGEEKRRERRSEWGGEAEGKEKRMGRRSGGGWDPRDMISPTICLHRLAKAL
jgi:hypothetical protein